MNDLSSSGGLTPDWLNAALRTGPMQIVLTFSRPTSLDMHVLIFLESPTLVSLAKGSFINYLTHFSLVFDYPPTYSNAFAITLLMTYHTRVSNSNAFANQPPTPFCIT